MEGVKRIMTSTVYLWVETAQGKIAMPVVHKNGALQVVRAQTQDPDVVFYNTVHDNGLRLPNTDIDVELEAILICNWCAENFPEFAKADLNLANITKTRQKEFKDKLWNFKFVELKLGEDDADFPY
jgi:hypothetical protein